MPRILEDGVIIVLVTPLKNDRSQDTASLRKLVSYYLQAGVNGFTALGEVSESPRLSETERSENLKEVMEQVNGRVPVVVGTSRESTQLAVEAAIWAEEQGASALMIAPPKNLKLRDNAILAHYSAISDAVSIPIVVQDEPESDHPYMSEDLLTKIGQEAKRVQFVKLEDPPTPMKLSRLRELAGSELKVFGASHGRSYLWELERGAVGIMTASPIPEYLIAIWRAFQRGELKKARELFFYSLPLAHFYGEIALAIKKEVLVSRGIIETANMKQPSSELREADRKALLELVHWMETNIERSSGIPPFRWTQPEMSR